ncbi:mucin-3B-like [Corythoichthys intestinalis]|uniref:mucin-3B-like n=1 Tax=Corythoichthys intestinalis TaxID=161448 RepID=UPI0025A5F39B|nr:mucin-3B-like [Corythoichthys intestinalis]
MFRKLPICQVQRHQTTPESGETTFPASTEALETTEVPETTNLPSTATPESGETTFPASTEAIETTDVPETTNLASTATAESGETTFPASTEALETTDVPETTNLPSTLTPESGETTVPASTEPLETTDVPETTNLASTATPEAGKTTFPASTEALETTDIPKTTNLHSTATPESGETTLTARTEALVTTDVPKTTNPSSTATPEAGETTFSQSTGKPDTTSSANPATTEPAHTSSSGTLTTTTTNPASTATTEATPTTISASTTETAKTTNPASTQTTEDSQTTNPPSTATTVTTVTTSQASTATTESIKTTNPASTQTTEAAKTTEPGRTPTTNPGETTVSGNTTTPETGNSTNPTSSAATTLKPYHCQNGGTFTATGCHCVSGFHGIYCQFLEESVNLDDIELPVKVGVVIDKEYKPDFDNTSSEAYIHFVAEFVKNIDAFYRQTDVRNFKEVIVTSVSRAVSQGLVKRSLPEDEKLRLQSDATAFHRVTPRQQGVKVSHDVVLLIPNNNNTGLEYVYDYIVVHKALATVVDSNTDFPYNVTEEPSVVQTNVSLETLCASQIKDPDLARHYKAVYNNSVLVCVNRCSRLYDGDKLICQNNGSCNVYRDVGAVCECQHLDSTWYLGKDCSLPIQQTAFYISLVLTLACLLATVASLTAYVIINKKAQMRKKDMKKKVVDKWFNDEFEWSRSDIPSTGPFDTGHTNPSFCYDTPPPRQRADSRQSNSAVSVFTIDGTEFSRDASLNRPPFQEIRIQRPQIRSTSNV